MTCDVFLQVAVWRCRGRVPVAVEATAALAEARAADTGTPPSDALARSAYALAIVRLVNGLVDPGQGGARAVSVAGLAARRGLPRLLVDLRHEAAHNELPSLAASRLGAATAVAWLVREYWDRQRAYLMDRHGRLAEAVGRLVASHSRDGPPGGAGVAPLPSAVPGAEAPASKKSERRAALSELAEMLASSPLRVLVEPLFASLLGGLAPSAARLTPGSAAALVTSLAHRWPHLPGLVVSHAAETALGDPEGAMCGPALALATELCRRHASWPAACCSLGPEAWAVLRARCGQSERHQGTCE